MEPNEQAPLQPKSNPAWMAELTDSREREQVIHARSYAIYHQGAGAPGHGQFLLIAKLAAMLDRREPFERGGPESTTRTQKIVWDPVVHGWRDVVTGVRVEVP